MWGIFSCYKTYKVRGILPYYKRVNVEGIFLYS